MMMMMMKEGKEKELYILKGLTEQTLCWQNNTSIIIIVAIVLLLLILLIIFIIIDIFLI